MRIEITRLVRLTLWGSELQLLIPGEIYEVAPAVGRVLVSEGWARERGSAPREPWSDANSAAHDKSHPISPL